MPVTYLHSDAVIKYLPALDVEPSMGWHTQCDIERQARLAWAEKLECVGGFEEDNVQQRRVFDIHILWYVA